MPIDFYIDKKQRTVFTQAYEVLTENEILDLRNRVMTHPEFDSSFNQLSDYTNVTKFDVSNNFLIQYAQLEYFGRNSKRAFIASDDLVFGSIRTYQAWHESFPSEVKTFRHLKDARKWLGLK